MVKSQNMQNITFYILVIDLNDEKKNDSAYLLHRKFDVSDNLKWQLKYQNLLLGYFVYQEIKFVFHYLFL